MEIRFVSDDIAKIEADAIVINHFEGVKEVSDAAIDVDKALNEAVSSLIKQGEIKGKLGEVNIIHTLGKLPARMVAVAGLGKRENFNLDKVRQVAGNYCRSLQKLNCYRVATVFNGAGIGGIVPEAASQAITEGSLLGLYNFQKYKKSEYSDIKELLIVEKDETKLLGLEQAVCKGRIIAEATILARDMVNEPANYMTPTKMEDIAREISETHKLEFKLFDFQDMQSMGMEALLGVARGSSQPPKLLIIGYKGDEKSKSEIGFIGKGITFDSGGISIKPSEGMADMKDDMAGAAAVMGAIQAIAQLKPKINVTAIIPATENMPGGTALKPGDILKSMNGKTIEVVNTDAEGRLILADALSYAVREGLSPLIDLATLTGACRIALGTGYSGVFTNNQELVDRVLQAANKAGEKSWQMPMPEEYKEMNKSQIADIRNTGNRHGGAITAALFLSEFVSDVPWVHVDIAGTVSSDKENGYTVKGATGVGVRTLVELALSLDKGV